jgi:hypothetical protein
VLGPDYDTPAELPDGLDHYEPKRRLALAELQRAEAEGDGEVIDLMSWELGLVDLLIAPLRDVSIFGTADHASYATHYRFTANTVAHARERASETNDLILKLHYLEYVLSQMEPRGREWVDLQGEILHVYRDYVDGCRANAPADAKAFTGLYIDAALRATARLMSRPGVLRSGEPADWASWLVGLAEDSRSLPVRDPTQAQHMRHRWVAAYLVHLAALPAAALDGGPRTRALGLLEEASAFYRANPLNDDFEARVAEAEMVLRKHWGEAGTHELLVRRKHGALVRRAEFHRSTGNGLLTAHFFREARRLVEEHRQYFTGEDVTHLQRGEQAALEHAVAAGEFGVAGVDLEISKKQLDYTRDSPEATMEALVGLAVATVPNRSELAGAVRQTNAVAPLYALLSRSVVGPGKVVGESRSVDENTALDVEQRGTWIAKIAGVAVATTALSANSQVALGPDHLVAPLAALPLDVGTQALIRHACERLLAGDFVSATHIIVLRAEDVLRQVLRHLGVDTTVYVDVGDGTTRTDDAPLGALMRRSLQDGRTVRQYLGPDLWDHIDSVLNAQTGLNLRNAFAHGLARPEHCTAATAGIALALLYQLAHAVQQAAAANQST